MSKWQCYRKINTGMRSERCWLVHWQKSNMIVSDLSQFIIYITEHCMFYMTVEAWLVHFSLWFDLIKRLSLDAWSFLWVLLYDVRDIHFRLRSQRPLCQYEIQWRKGPYIKYIQGNWHKFCLQLLWVLVQFCFSAQASMPRDTNYTYEISLPNDI